MGAYCIPILSAHSIRHGRWQPLQHCAQAHMRFCQQYREATKSSTTSVGTRMAAATADPLSASSHGIGIAKRPDVSCTTKIRCRALLKSTVQRLPSHWNGNEASLGVGIAARDGCTYPQSKRRCFLCTSRRQKDQKILIPLLSL